MLISCGSFALGVVCDWFVVGLGYSGLCFWIFVDLRFGLWLALYVAAVLAVLGGLGLVVLSRVAV